MKLKHLTWLSLAAILAACNGDTSATDETGETGVPDTDTDTDTDTGPAPDVDGSVSLIHYSADADYPEETQAYGVFLETGGPYWDASLCIFAGFCGDALPADGATTELSGEFDFETYVAINVGALSFAGAPLSTAAFSSYYGIEIYSNDGEIQHAGGNDYGLTIDASSQFPSGYAGSADVVGPEPVVVTSHDAMSRLTGSGFGGGLIPSESLLNLTWELPSSADAIFMIKVGISDDDGGGSWIVRTEDDGAYDLDLSSFTSADEASVTLMLIRMAHTEVTVDGQVIKVSARTEQWLYGNLTTAEAIDNPATMVDTCTEAGAMTALEAGSYTFGGSFSDAFTDQIDTTCTDWGSTGADAMIKVNLGSSIAVDFRYASADAVIYLMSDCSSDTCEAVADDTLDGEGESFSFDGTGAYTLVLDAWTSGSATDHLPDDYLLNITIE